MDMDNATLCMSRNQYMEIKQEYKKQSIYFKHDFLSLCWFCEDSSYIQT